MKKIILYLIISCFFVACVNDNKNTGEAIKESKSSTESNTQPSQLFDVPWAAVLDSATQKITMTQTEGIADKDLNVGNVTESLNRKYAEILISEPTQRYDTVFVKINNAQYLTQASGTMGAEIYLAESTYSFTQIPGVSFVNFDFNVGDHASPGTYIRSDFKFKD